jgi:hypothetical protein
MSDTQDILSRKQVAFWLDVDLVEQFNQSKNKTTVINTALRAHYAKQASGQSVEERLEKLEALTQQLADRCPYMRG